MRPTRNLLLAAAATLAAIALTASSTFAQSVEMIDEATGQHCGIVVEGSAHAISGGCELTAVSESQDVVTYQHTGTSEAVTSICETEFTAHVGPAGGYIAVDDSTIHTNPLAGCVVTACDEAGPHGGGPGEHPELEWPLSGLFEYGGGQEAMIATFCIRPFNTDEGQGNTFCTVFVDIDQVEHTQELSANEEPCFENPNNEISGHWITTGEGDEVELEHIHYP